MPTNTSKHTENGQAIVLLALAFVVMLGFTAIAVDGSMIYADRRLAQSASDSAALAGAAAAAYRMEELNVTAEAWNCQATSITAVGQAACSAAIQSAQAIARVYPRSTLAHGYAIVALNPDDCQGMNTGAQMHGRWAAPPKPMWTSTTTCCFKIRPRSN